MMSSSSKTSCPICNKDFNREEIEKHAEKCLFLNSSSDFTSKRSCEDFASKKSFFISPKRQKPNNACGEPLPSTSSVDGNMSEKSDHFLKKPLSEKMRPTSLCEFFGQQHILAPNSVFRNLLEQQNIPSMILWGPPGCGKTSLAHIMHKMSLEKSDIRFVKLSATLAGVNDVKDIVKVAKNEMNLCKRHTILFMDEIHRFNKLQQDIFLPHVESGIITLIGATTENPSFSLNSALLSRCRVFILEKLNASDILAILSKAAKALNLEIVNDLDNNLGTNSRITIMKESLDWLSEICDGDARIAINSLQMTIDSNVCKTSSHITLEDIREGIKRSHLLYDRKGEEHYNIISALHKSIRASDDNAALYWLTRMLEGGEDPLYIARRLVRAASEDVGLVDPMALTLAVSAMQGCQLVGMPECDVLLAQVTVYLARTHKSQEVYQALLKAKHSVKNHKGALPSVPLHLRNASTKLMQELGYGQGYNKYHKNVSNLTYMPEGLESTSFFQ